MRETYFRTVVRGPTLEAIKKAAEKAIQEFFGRSVPFAIDIDPHLMGETVDGVQWVAMYEAEIRCRGFEI